MFAKKIKTYNYSYIDNRLTKLYSIFYKYPNRQTIYKNAGFLIAIMMFFAISSIPAYAEPTIETATIGTDQYGNYLLTDIQPIDLSTESDIPSNELFIKVKTSSKKSIRHSPRSDDTGITSLDELNKKHGAIKFEQIAKNGAKSNKDSQFFNWYKITFDTPEEKITKGSDKFKELTHKIDSYRSDPNIEAVETDIIITIDSTPNDPYYSSTGSWGQSYPDLWGIKKINSGSAWDSTTGSSSIIVADIDTGVDRNHPDLKNNVWVNSNEIPDNGIDDDTNGYIDDYYGWDWVNNDNNPMDDHGHGTHTAGTIAASGNNGLGVAGVNWNSKIMALKFLNSGGSGSLSNAVEALQYAADMGAHVSSNSWGSSEISVMLDDAIQYEHDKGMIIVVAAGNSNMDALDYTPASADMAITVAASDYNDAKASFSNWGQKIDVTAPGVDILSTRASVNPMCTAAKTVGTDYCRVSGTSMATPHVAGLAALILAKDPTLTNEEVRQIIRTGAVDLGTQGKDGSFGYGRIDAAGSISISNAKPLAPIINSPKSRETVFGQTLLITGSVPGPNFASYTLEAGSGRNPATWTTLETSTAQVIDGVLATVDVTQLGDGNNVLRLTATDTTGKQYQFQINDVEVDNFDAVITSPVTLASSGVLDVMGDAQTKNGLLFDNYVLEWGAGASPTLYSTSGITLANNGQQPVLSGDLGTWDTSGLTSGTVYTLRLTITASSGVSAQYTTTVTIDSDLVSGWPKMISRSPNCIICEATPTIADLNNDGVNEVIITSPNNMIYVFRKDGTNFPGFPVSVTAGEHFTWPANVADLDNDGIKEIIAASVTSSGTSKVYVIRSDGTLYPGWTKPVHVIAQQDGDGTPTIADLNGDGYNDMIVIDPYNKKMHAYQLDGTELAGFPKALPFNSLDFPGAPSILDMDNDGIPEIAYGLKDTFYLFDNQGDVLPGWPYVAPAYNGRIINFESSPSSGDIDGDGNLEVLAIGHDGGVTTPIYAWRKDGTLVQNWPMSADSIAYGHSPMNSPSAVDIDNDGKDEVIVGLRSIAIYDIDGKKSIGTGIGAKISPAISDIDGDGRYEFAGIRDNKVQIGNDDGSIAWERTFATNEYFLSPAVFSDLDNNGRVELAVVQGKFSSESGDIVAYLWEFPDTSASATNGWPMFLHDSQRSGRSGISEYNEPEYNDGIAPTTSITSPAQNSVVSGGVNVNVVASDNTGVGKVELYRNGVLVDTRTSGPYTFSWDTSMDENGQYTLQSKAYDAANNAGLSSLIIMNVNNNVDSIAPVVSITSPSDNSIVKRKSSVDISASASDNVGITKVEFTVNGIVICTDTSENSICTWKVPAKPGVSYILQALAYDVQGNAGTSDVVEVISK